MEFLSGFTQCWLPGPRCEVNWTAWAAVATAILGFLAWRTSVAAKEIAGRQEENAARDRDALGQIRGRLLLNEVVALNGFIAYTQNHLHLSGVDKDGRVKNAEAMGIALRNAASNPLPLSSEQIDHLHYFPDKIGHDLASLIGAIHKMKAGAQAILESDFHQHLSGATYVGETDIDFKALSDHLHLLFSMSKSFADEFATYLGVTPNHFDPKDYMGPLK